MRLDRSSQPLPSRRDCVRALVALTVAGQARPALALADDTADAAAAAAVERDGKKAGLGPFGKSQTTHYQAIGDASAEFREEALSICEKLAGTYQRYFTDKKLPCTFPQRRLTVVALSGRKAYQAFKGEEVLETEGGHYDIEADRLVIFDARGEGGSAAAFAGINVRRLNTLSLVHEAIHQLTFDTGLLDRNADVPVLVSEGLATFGELWTREAGKSIFGQTNQPRLRQLRENDWIPVEELLTDDTLFGKEESAQAAYAIAWLLVHTLLRTRAPKFRAYLELVRTRKDETHRGEDARSTLGDLEKLDRDLKKIARSQL